MGLSGCGGSGSALAACVLDEACDPLSGEWRLGDDGPRTFVQVSAGMEHTCALDDTGDAVCVGTDNHYESSPPEPGTLLQPVDRPLVAIAAGGASNCGLDEAGTIACWGHYSIVAPVTPSGTFVDIRYSGGLGCVLDEQGALSCWGSDQPEGNEPPEGSFVDFGVGIRHGCALDDEGRASCWGDVVDAPDEDVVFTQIDAGGRLTCGVRADASLSCFGYVDDEEESLLTPPEGRFTRVAVGHSNVCALEEDGHIVCFGAEYTMLHMTPDEPFVDVTVGAGHACGLRADGTARCWGKNDDGQLDLP